MKNLCCTLYTFATRTDVGIETAKVARLTDGVPDDWHIWPEERYPERTLLEIAGIEFVDETASGGRQPAVSVCGRTSETGA